MLYNNTSHALEHILQYYTAVTSPEFHSTKL